MIDHENWLVGQLLEELPAPTACVWVLADLHGVVALVEDLHTVVDIGGDVACLHLATFLSEYVNVKSRTKPRKKTLTFSRMSSSMSSSTTLGVTLTGLPALFRFPFPLSNPSSSPLCAAATFFGGLPF